MAIERKYGLIANCQVSNGKMGHSWSERAVGITGLHKESLQLTTIGIERVILTKQDLAELIQLMHNAER